MGWFTDICDFITGPVSAATGVAYGTGASAIAGPVAGAAVGSVITDAVQDGMQNGVCVLPEALSGGHTTATDPLPSPYPAGDML